MNELPQQLLNGIAIGGIYALNALGLTMIYGMMNVVNIAHGELYMLGALFAFFFANILGLPYFLAVIVAVGVVAIMGFLIERLTLRPIQGQPMVLTTLVTLGVSLILQNVSLIITGGVPRYINSPFSEAPIVLGMIQMSPARLFAVIASGVIIVLTHLFLTKTVAGNSIRAAFQDKDASALVGINVNRIYMLTYGLGAALAALGGGLLGTIAYVDPSMGAKGLMKSFVVVTIGGMGNLIGAIFGGLILGVVETLATAFISSEYKDVIGFIMVVVILLFLPQGLFGAKERKA
jgi:branched-chain amino acid transport system permease protein